MTTITEALAEIKTLNKRWEKKAESVLAYLWRPENLKDPLEKQGGSHAHVRDERQAMADLQARIVQLRRAIAAVNATTKLTINGQTYSIEEWLIWKREVAPHYADFLKKIRAALTQAHNEANRQRVFAGRMEREAQEKPTDVVVNINEQDFAKQVEGLEDTLGQLDGQLSLKNATININVN